jgi:hypothetical protein
MLGLLALPFAAVACVALMRLLRAQGAIRTRTSRCAACGSRGPVVGVHYWKNTGMLIMRQTAELNADLCRSCGVREGLKMTLHTAVLGWWGTLSFFLTLFILPTNTAQLVWVAGLRSSEAMASDALSGHIDYARNLLATKDRETVVDVLVKTTGASPGEVGRFLDSLPRG